MLILARNVGETIHIGDDIVIVITALTDGQVKVGIAAPVDIAVHRGEIYQRIKNAAKTSTNANGLRRLDPAEPLNLHTWDD